MAELELPDALRDELRAAWHRYLDLLNPIRPALHAYCQRLTRDLWDAEDLVQDTLLRAFGSLGRHHDPVRNPRAYLLRTATHVWIDQLRRRETEAKVLARSESPEPASAPSAGALRDAGRTLLERLAPRERAALVLKDVFDLSLEESAEVLETTTGAVKAALHRGRGRLREAAEEQPSVARNTPSPALVDRFVELFNASDRAGLLALVLGNATAENVGVSAQWGDEQHRGPHSWFEGALGGHPEWPEQWRTEARRAERALFRGEPIVLFRVTRGGREAVEVVIRLEEQEGRVSRLRCYAFCPETTREVCRELDLPVRTGIYRYPTPEPGRSYGEAAAAEGANR